MLALLLVEGGEGGPPPPPETIFSWAFDTFAAEGSVLDNIYGFRARFDPAHHDFLGKFWFDAIGFSMLASFMLILFAFLATRDYKRVPHGIQNVFEWIVGLLFESFSSLHCSLEILPQCGHLRTEFEDLRTDVFVAGLPGGRDSNVGQLDRQCITVLVDRFVD